MKRVSKILALVLVVLMGTSIMLTGCGSGSGQETKANTSTLAASSSSTSAPKQLKELTIWGVMDPQVSAQQIIAEKKGFFEEQGLKVTNKLAQSGTEIGPMIAGGSAPISFESNYTDISLASNNVGVKILAPVANIGGTQSVVARKGLNITKAKDLEGKKIGMASGSGVLIAIRKMCDELGVDIKKITFVNLQPADQVAAIQKGDIDAMACWEPWVGKAVAMGGQFLFSGTKSELPDKKGDVNWLNFHTTIQVTDDFLKKDPDTLIAFMTAIKKATDFINSNRDESADILSKELKIDKTELLGIMSKNEYSNAIDDKFVSGTNELSNFMLEMKNIKTKPDIKTFTDYSILQKVDPSLVKVK
jgi:ABC-type nitrate/sulfonate/bicarbonate transport system substrate-binding protein